MPPSDRARQPPLPLGPSARPTFAGGDFIRSIHRIPSDTPAPDAYPFNIPVVRSFQQLDLHPAITFLIGENGSGKSTLLEAIAIKLGLNPEGGSRDHQMNLRATHSPLHEHLRVEWTFGRRPSDWWFLRAESFYTVATEVELVQEETPSPMPYLAYGGKSLHAQSHGEAFLSLLSNRLQGNGVYLFDEPESALSPQRQLSVLTLLHRLVYHRSQLIIATHSPILLAYPHSRIYECGEEGLREVAYQDTEHYRITRDFLNTHPRMLDLLLEEEESDLDSKRR